MRLIDVDELLKKMEILDWQETYLPIHFKEMVIDETPTAEPVYFPPCVDCQNRSKEILTAYNNMKKMQAYTKEEVITMLEKIKAEIEQTVDEEQKYDEKWAMGLRYAVKIIDKYKAEIEPQESEG